MPATMRHRAQNQKTCVARPRSRLRVASSTSLCTVPWVPVHTRSCHVRPLRPSGGVIRPASTTVPRNAPHVYFHCSVMSWLPLTRPEGCGEHCRTGAPRPRRRHRQQTSTSRLCTPGLEYEFVRIDVRRSLLLIGGDPNSPMAVLLRTSMTSEDSADILRRHITAQAVDAVAETISEPDARLRATLAGAMLTGSPR